MSLFDEFIAALKEHRQYSTMLAYRLDEMRRRSELGSDEINDLIIQVSVGRFAGKQLFAKLFADAAEKQQLTDVVNTGEDAVRQIVDHGWIFILPIIIDYVGPEHRFDDLWEIGCTALQRALITYHYVPSCEFQDYVSVWIQQLIEESFQDNSVYVPSLRLLCDHQRSVEAKLEAQLQRSPSIEELALSMRYLPVQSKQEIFVARQKHTSLSMVSERHLQLAMTKTLLVRDYRAIAKEFTMSLSVTIDGSNHHFSNVVRLEQALAQEVKELYRCGFSLCTNQEDLVSTGQPWRCRSCRQEHRYGGCGRWEEVTSVHKQPERICLWLDDGRKFFIEDDFWTIARQLSSSLDY